MKEFLSQNRCTFTVRLVDEDESAYDALLAMGHRTVPVTVIGGRVIRGFDPAALAAAIARKGQDQSAPTRKDDRDLDSNGEP